MTKLGPSKVRCVRARPILPCIDAMTMARQHNAHKENNNDESIRFHG
jgi:hypothetical protein